MTDKERLEEVKGVVSTWKTILSEGKFPNITSEEVELVETLIIERMQELESKNKLLKSNLSVVQGYYKNMIKINKDIVEQNQRYRKAMTTAIGESECIMYQGKSKDVDVEYARNIKRDLTDALEDEE